MIFSISYEAIPKFVLKYEYKYELAEFENILVDSGGSNIITDSERALITLTKAQSKNNKSIHVLIKRSRQF